MSSEGSGPSAVRDANDVATWDAEADVVVVGLGCAGACAAIEAAGRAFEGPWSRFSGTQRARLLRRLATLFEENFEELLEIETRDVGRALRVSKALRFGCVWINDHIPLASEMPHGGYGESGYGKDLSMYAVEEYTNIKHVMASLS